MVLCQEQGQEEKQEEWEIGGDTAKKLLNHGKEKQKQHLEKF